MFGFMKKDKDDKDRKKKEKRPKDVRRVKDKATLTLEELKRLDEARKSLISKTRKKREEKLPSGITADYMDQFRSQLGTSRDKESLAANAQSTNNFKLLRDHYEALASGSSIYSDSNSEGTISGASPVQSDEVSRRQSSDHINISHGFQDLASPTKCRDEDEIFYENLSSAEKKFLDQSSKQSIDSQQLMGDDKSIFVVNADHTSLDSQEEHYPNKMQCLQPEQVNFYGAESSGWNHVKKFDADLQLPVVVKKIESLPRVLSIFRTVGGDFGFSLRRAVVTEYVSEGICSRKTIVLAEPGTMGSSNHTGLLPGDRLMQVNNISVEDKPRDEIIQLIKSSHESVTLAVKPVPELAELSSRQTDDGTIVHLPVNNIMLGTLKSSATKKRQIIAQSEEQIEARQEWLKSEKVWLVHRGGFCASFVRPADPEQVLAENKVCLMIEHSQAILQADEEDIEKANPSNLDLSEDVGQLKYLNESSILHCLRQRYGSSLIHTYAGSSMIILNPSLPMAIYSEKVIQMFRGCHPDDMPPHIYAMAQSAYHDMISTRKDQSIVFVGRSGAGKTTNFRHVLHFLALASTSPSAVLTVERLNAISTLVEAFGNGRTLVNTNATRFTQTFTLNFDTSGQMVSASVQVSMAEIMRVVRRPDGEPNYHIFYQLLSGADADLRQFLELNSLSEPNFFMTPLQRVEDKQKAGTAWARICAAFDVMMVSKEEQKAIWRVLAAIYHLGTAGKITAFGNGPVSFEKPYNVQKAAKLLGTSIEELSKVIFQFCARSNARSSSPSDSHVDALQGMVCGLYYETFSAVVSLINRCLFSSVSPKNSIVVVDAPGCQNAASVGGSTGASLGDLCHNYVQERLQMLFHHTTFTSQTNQYAQENIDCSDGFGELGTPAPLLSLLDQHKNISSVRKSVDNAEDDSLKGILWMIDEESLYAHNSDQSLVDKIFCSYGTKEYSKLISRGNTPLHFYLNHFQGTNKVLYNAKGWLNASRENQVIRRAAAVLQESNCESISRLYVFSRGPVSNCVNGPQALHRASSNRRPMPANSASNALMTRSVCLQVKLSVDALIEKLRGSKVRFVHCMLAQHNSGLCDLKSVSTHSQDNLCDSLLVNIPLLRSQMRGCQLVDSVRVHKQGFPKHFLHDEFLRQFAVLWSSENKAASGRDSVQELLHHLDVDGSTYRIGTSQVFLRHATLRLLEEQRQNVLSDVITALQARCRGWLARKRLQKLKVQETAIRCIQKNVRKFLLVRDWPWWRLLIRITPLLDVHRTQLQLTTTTDELCAVKSKFDKLQEQHHQLEHEKEKLQSRLYDMTVDLTDEQNTSQLVNERLQTEQLERLKLQKEVSRLQEDVKKMTYSNGDHEMMSRDVAMLHGSSSNGDVPDLALDSSVYKQKYEGSQRQIELLNKQCNQMQTHHQDQLLLAKKQADQKALDGQEQTEEQKQIVGQLKKKSQRLLSEMNDIKILLEDQTSRNNLLEKKQRRFDQDLQNTQDQVRKEKVLRENAQNERDQHLAAKYAMEQETLAIKFENELKDETISALRRQLDDLHSSGSLQQETIIFNKIKTELELKVKDQEEELDELAGQVQMLEAAKTRLEMSMEQARKENKFECAQRDQDAEEYRMSTQKKLKCLESEIEGQYAERSQLVRDKHELERNLADANQKALPTHDEDFIHRLKKDYKKTKVLLRDTQAELERALAEGSQKILIRQLKTQLEDAEFSQTSALKGKQSAEADLSEMQSMLDEALRSKKDAEEKCHRTTKEKAEIYSQMEENEEELTELMKKYKSNVLQLSHDQITLSEQTQQIAELEHEKQALHEKWLELSCKVEVLEGESANMHTQRRLQMKIKEMESKLELEVTTRHRLESQISRLKDQAERINADCESATNKQALLVDECKKANRQLREAREDLHCAQQNHTHSHGKTQQLQKQLDLADSEVTTLKSDLKLAFKRIEDLQQALQRDLSDSDSELLESASDSELSLSSYVSASANYRRPYFNALSKTPSLDQTIASKDDLGSLTTLAEQADETDGSKDTFS